MKRANKQPTGVDKVSQVLLYVVMFFLLVFLGMGIYFVIRGFMDTTMDTRTIGFVGIGIFFFGMGMVVLMQTGMMSDPNGSFLDTFFMANSGVADDIMVGSARKEMLRAEQLKPVLEFSAMVTVGSLLSKQCVVMVCDDGIWFQNLTKSLEHVFFDKVSDVSRDGNAMEVSCSCDIGEDSYEGIVSIEVDNALRLKMASDEIQRHIG